MQNLTEAIEKNARIRLRVYSLSNTVEEKIHTVLTEVLTTHNCEALHSPVYTVLKELMINAVKANYKSIYFETHKGESAEDTGIDYETTLQLFLLEMRRDDGDELQRIAKDMRMNVECIFHVIDEELFIMIKNPVPMTPLEQERVNKKIHDARQCNDISEYFMMNMDDPNQEGAGLGLVLVSIMLKNMGVPDNFGVVSDEKGTKAFFNVPLTTETMNRFLASESA